MSAIRCKLLLCSLEAQAASKITEDFIEDILESGVVSSVSDNALAKAYISVQQYYIKQMKNLSSELTDGI